MPVDYRHAISDISPIAIAPGVTARIFNGRDKELQTISLMIGEVVPGDAIRMHRYDYEEVFILQSGRGVYTIGDTTVDASTGVIVIIPAGIPHRFANPGDEVLRHTAVHGAPAVTIEWLE